jgi:tRNA threonylcarbamoyladenosine biosynthesis protein TsaB
MATLAVETSTATFAAAVRTADTTAVRVLAGVRPADRDLPALVAGLLAEVGLSFADIDRIAVDVGPGNLTAVRTGVAYANGLAFALGVGVATADSLELMAARHAESDPGTPVLALRNAGGGRAYAGLFVPGLAPRYLHGTLAEVVAVVGGPEVVVAGDFRAEVPQLRPEVLVEDSGIAGPDVDLVLALTADRGTLDPTRERPAAPLTDSSELFGGAE